MLKYINYVVKVFDVDGYISYILDEDQVWFDLFVCQCFYIV